MYGDEVGGHERGQGSRTVQPRHRGGRGCIALGLAGLPLLVPLLLLLLLGRLGVPPDQGVILQLGARLEGGGDEKEVRVLQELRLFVSVAVVVVVGMEVSINRRGGVDG